LEQERLNNRKAVTSHGPTSQGKNIVVKAAKYSLENFEGGIITFICPNRILSTQIQVNK
jgi:hypothetical protein